MRIIDAFFIKKIGMYDELSKWGHTAIVGKTGCLMAKLKSSV